MSAARVHDQIVDLITKAHAESESIELKIHALLQATELILYHTGGNERIDEFLETFLSMHVNKDPAIRRFSAYFLEILCFTRSRYACSCLEVLVSLLQDSDYQVQIFALRAARVIYKRALYWISVQQREPMYVQAARESVGALDHVLARIVHLITSSRKEVFCESIRCAQSVVLVQSNSSFGAKSQAQVEAAGCSSLEDLKLVDSAALDESKLKGQSDRLFTALCALLVKKREEQHSAPEMELITLIHAVGIVGQQRSSYAGAAAAAFSELAQEAVRFSDQTRGALVSELKRILASRHCIQWQPKILPVLASLGVEQPEQGMNTATAVLHAEMERLKHEVEAESGLDSRASKRQKCWSSNSSLDEKGERLMTLSEMADALKVPDENQAEAICSVRANTPLELAKMALSVLGKVPKHFDDELMALVRVNRSSATAGGSVSFERRVKAAKAQGIRVCDFLPPADVAQSDEEMEMVATVVADSTVQGEEGERDVAISGSTTQASITDILDVENVAVFIKLVVGGLHLTRFEKLQVMSKFLLHHISRNNSSAVVELFKAVFRYEIMGGDVSSQDLGQCFENFGVHQIKEIVTDLPLIPTGLLARLDTIAAQGSDVAARRTALTTLASLTVSKPGVASDCLNRLLAHCQTPDESLRTDALKLLLAKVYRPQKALLKSQWPYSDKCLSPVVDTLESKISKLDFMCSEDLEGRARSLLLEAARSGQWDKAWVVVALCSRKPQLIHSVLATLMDAIPEPSSSIPPNVTTALGQSIVLLPPDVIEPELEILVKQYKAVKAAHKKKIRNEFILPLLSAISATDRGLTGTLADAALSFRK